MRYIYVNQLPPQVRAEIRRDAYRINMEWYGDDITKEEHEYFVEECVLCSKVRDVMGHEDGMLNADKYSRWLRG